MPSAFIVDGRRYLEHEAGLAQALAFAYRRRERPVCACQPNGVNMYIAAAGEGHVIKRMPYTASRHAPSCPHARDTVSRSVQVRRRAVVEQSGDDERLKSRCEELVKTLHRLWDSAGLAHWRPAFRDKRRWAVVRSLLLRATSIIDGDGVPRPNALYVPETFRLQNRDAIEARRKHWWTARTINDPTQQLLLLGELKRIDLESTLRCVVKHLPDEPFDITPAAYTCLNRRFVNEIAVWSACQGSRLVMLAAVELYRARPVITCAALMSTTEEWLPVTDALDLARVQRLVSEQRTFQARWAPHPASQRPDDLPAPGFQPSAARQTP